MSFGSPESSKDFPGLYGHERHSDSDSEAQASKQLIGKRKDKKEKDIGYAALGDSSGDEEEDGKSPLRGKLGNPFKFSKKEKREKDKQRDHKEKELKAKESKERDLKLRKDAREMYKEEKIREKVREEKSKDKVKEEKLKEKEKHKEEKNKEKEKIKEEKVKEKAKEKSKEEKSKDKVKDPKEKAKEVKELKRKESLKDSTEERKKKKKDQNKVKERKKSDPAVALEEEPVFGVPLALAVERSKCHDGVQLPAVVRECIDYIEQNGLNCEGIYRLSGVKSKVQQLKRGYNLRDTVCLYDHEPHTVASLLKLFLRELPEPVLTAELLPLFDAAAGEKAPERRVKQLSELLDRLPDPNRRLVQYMLKHMEHIIKREKINKMNVQNVSLVLSPTMQISHRVLNAFFLYGKILFSGVTIKRYVPPIADGELPDSADAIREEIEKQESLLTQLHRELKAGSISQRREEQLWEAQRILTQLKRRQRFVTKRGEAESVGRPAEPEPSGDAAPAAADDTAAHRLERTVQIINEDNVTVIQIGEKAAPQPAAAAAAAAGPEPATAGPEPTASSELESAAAPESEPELAAEPETVQKPETEQKPKPEQELKPGTEQKPEQELKPEQEPELKPEREQELKTELKPELKTELKPEQEQRQELKPEQEMKLKPEQEQEQEPEPEQEQDPEPEAAGGETDGPVTSLPPPGDESQASFSDLHRRIVADAARSAEPAAAAADAGAAVAAESEETTDLLRQLVLLKLEEDELVSTGRELRSRLAAERSEIGRLRDTIQEMETLYKYRTYSVDSSDDSSGEDSEDSDTEEDMIRQLCDIVRHNQQIEAKNAQLVMSIHEERRCCQKRRAQIRYLELQPSGAP